MPKPARTNPPGVRKGKAAEKRAIADLPVTFKRADTRAVEKYEDTLTPEKREQMILDKLAGIARRLLAEGDGARS